MALRFARGLRTRTSTNHAASSLRGMGSSRIRAVCCRAQSGASPVRMTLPIFPLSVVALPSATVPLMIFEARYRVLFSTLLAGSPGVEEGLVQADSPWCGTKKLGMCFTDGDGRLASIGTVLEIVDFAHVQDGRLFVTTKGRERFKIVDIVKDKPVLLCEVEVLEEDADDSTEVKELASEVADLLRNTIRFNQKMNNINATEDQLEPEELAGLGPRELSYWIVSFFSDVKLLQQNLLEEDSTMKRLTKEKEILSETVKYYSASLALKNAFSGPTAEGGETTEGGTPGSTGEGGEDAGSSTPPDSAADSGKAAN